MRLENADDGIETEDLREHFAPKQRQKDQRRLDQRGQEHEGSGADEVERGQQAKGQRAQATDVAVVASDSSGKAHAGDVRRQDGFTPGPHCQRTKSEEHEQDKLGLHFRGLSAECLQEPGRYGGQGREEGHTAGDKDKRLQSKGGKQQT